MFVLENTQRWHEKCANFCFCQNEQNTLIIPYLQGGSHTDVDQVRNIERKIFSKVGEVGGNKFG